MAIEIAEGSSLRQAAKKRDIDTSSAYKASHLETWRPHYALAREIAADYFGDLVEGFARAAVLGTKVDGRAITPDGARVYLEQTKWRVGRMMPASVPVQEHTHNFGDLTSDERVRRIAELAASMGFTKKDNGG